MIYTRMMDTPEYKELYEKAKIAYPDMEEYFLQIACLSYLKDQNIISTSNIEISNEIQEELSAK
jgi:hypothetical protein